MEKLNKWSFSIVFFFLYYTGTPKVMKGDFWNTTYLCLKDVADFHSCGRFPEGIAFATSFAPAITRRKYKDILFAQSRV